MMNAQEFRKSLKAVGAWPCLPPAASAALRLSSYAPEYEVLAGAAAADGGLTALLLNHLGHSHRANTLEEALPDIGVAPARRLILRHYASTLLPANATAHIDPAAHWQHAHRCGAVAEHIAAHRSSVFAAESYAAAMLHDIGIPLLSLLDGEAFGRAVERSRLERQFPLASERLELGVDHVQAGKWLLEAWGLPAEYIAVAWLHHHPPRSLAAMGETADLVNIVALADLLVRQNAGEPAGAPIGALIEDRQRALAISPAEMSSFSQFAQHLPQEPAKGELTFLQETSTTRRLQHRLERMQALHSLGVRLPTADDEEGLLQILGASLQEAFSAQSGACVVREKGCIRAGVWLGKEPQRFHELSTPHDSTESLTLIDHLAHVARLGKDPEEWTGCLKAMGLSKRPRTLQAPLSTDGRDLGVIVLEVAYQSATAHQEDSEDLLRYAEAFASIWKSWNQTRHLREQGEQLATALWEQDLRHGDDLRRQQQAGLAQMAAGVAQEMNNPLAVISGRAQILMSRMQDPEEVKALETILAQSRRARKLLTDAVQCARPAQPKLEPCLLQFMLHQLMAQARPLLEAQGIQITEDYAQGVPRVQVDRKQIEQVVANVLLNAEQALSGQAGTVSIRLRAGIGGSSVVMEIEDSGPGIAPHVLPDVFEPFHTTRRGGDSAGLGLPIARAIVESHGGRLWLDCAGGLGTVCTIVLPVPEVEEIQDTPPSDAPQPQHRERRSCVLVVDEDEVFRQVMREAMEGRGLTVRTAADGLEAMAALMAHTIGLVLLDLRITGLEGGDLVAQIRQRFSTVPIIGMAPNGTPGVADALGSGAAACLVKPFELGKLLGAIEHELTPRHVA